MSKEELARFERARAPEHREIHERARAYSLWVHRWLDENAQGENRADRDPADPLSVISWFATLNGSKIYRALTGLAEFDGDREFPPDHEGSAKVAMIGIERSHAAWLQLVADRRVSESAAAPCIAELVWLGEQLERVFPEARAFVRPGFDEPDAVSRMK